MSNHTFIVNGERVTVDTHDDVRLLWVLRDLLGITGPKYGCGLSVCQACTSHINGHAFKPCAVRVGDLRDDDEIITIEGLADTVETDLHPAQQAWIDNDVAQCGFCQAGQIMAAVDLVNRVNAEGRDIDDGDLDTLRNICRCGTYPRIREAIRETQVAMRRPTAAPSLRAITPARLAESRDLPDPTIDGAFAGFGRISADSTFSVQVTGRGGVPGTAVAVMLNVISVLADGPGFLTVHPTGTGRPTASSLNYLGSGYVSSSVFAAVGQGGTVDIYSLRGTHLVVDVTGYVPAGSDVGTLGPARLIDTRGGGPGATVDGRSAEAARLPDGGAVTVQAAGRGGVPLDATAVFVNMAAVRPAQPGFLSAFATGGSVPNASSVNYAGGSVVSNMAFVPLDDTGRFTIHSLAETDVIADVTGFARPDSSLQPVTPARLVETRSRLGFVTADGLHHESRLVGGGVLDFAVAGRAGVPAGAVAALLNVTAIFADRPGFLTIYPDGADRPNASNVNYVGGDVVCNAVLVPLSADGRVRLFSLAPTDVAVDVTGFVG